MVPALLLTYVRLTARFWREVEATLETLNRTEREDER